MTGRLLRLLELGARGLRRLGLGRLVDRAGASVGGLAARVPVRIDGLRLTGRHVGQLFYLRELARGRDRFLAELLRAAVPPGGVAVDAGAHIGYLTLVLAEAAGPDGRVLAIEPDPAAAATLRANVRRNGFEGRVVVIEAAVGAAPGEATLHVSGGGETSSLAPVPGARNAVSIAVRPIDDLVEEDPVDLVKLDLEGSEVEALHGMRRLLRRQPDLILVVELNPSLLLEMNTSAAELLALLEAEGFSIWQIDEEAGRLSPRVDLGRSEYVNLLCTRGRAQPPAAEAPRV